MCLKKCSKCEIEKPLSEFNNSARFKDGLYTICKSCISHRRKELRSYEALRIKTELHKIVLVENRILKQDDLSQCHTCRVEIPLSKTNHYCLDCQKKQRDDNLEKRKLSRKKWRDKNKDKQKEYNDSIKEDRREYDARRYALRKSKQ